MQVFKTIEERNGSFGIAIGFTETWLREQILNRLKDAHGYHGSINDHLITATFKILLDATLFADGASITDNIEWACDRAWSIVPTDPLDVAFDEFQRLSESVMEQATGLRRARGSAGLPDAITELLEAQKEYLRLRHDFDARTESDPVVGPSGL